MRYLVRILFVVCCFLGLISFFSATAEAGPWSKTTGHFYLKANGSAFLANGFRDAMGNLVEGVSYTGVTSSLYFEVGLLYGFQLQGTLPYTVAINAFDDGTRYTQGSFADGQIGLQWSPPYRLPVVLAVRANLKIPMYDINAFINKYQGKPAVIPTRFPVHGDGQVDATLWFSLGGSFGTPQVPLYSFVEVGYRFRTEAFTSATAPVRSFLDTFVFNSQLGWTFWRRMIFAANFRGAIALGDDIYTQSFLTLGPSFYLPVWRGLAIELTYDYTLWAKNASQGHNITLGISYAY